MPAGRQRNAEQDCSAHVRRGRRKLLDDATAAGQEAWRFEQVGARIPAKNKFGEDGDARALPRRGRWRQSLSPDFPVKSPIVGSTCAHAIFTTQV
jgi:hypothetical protein